MLDAFIAYERETRDRLEGHRFIGVPIGTRLRAIMRGENSWRLWIATNDFKHGTYYTLYNDGAIYSTTARRDEGDEHIVVRPTDDMIRRQK